MRRLGIPLLLVACAGEGPAGECAADAECASGRVCHQAECVPPAKLACVEGGPRSTRLLVRPESVDFGPVAGAPVHAELLLENGGDCTLQIRTVAIRGGSSSRFGCASCAGEISFPRDVLPGRSLALDLLVTPGPPGMLSDVLVVSSSDPERFEHEVPLQARSAGEPKLVVTPRAIDFGYVPVGRSGERVVQAINAAEGSAPLVITGVELAGSPAFSLSPRPTTPAELLPAIDDPSARLAITVRFAPPMDAVHTATLTVTPENGTPLLVALTGAKDPPDVRVTPASIAFGDVLLGTTVNRRVTIQNTGRSPLVASRRLVVGHPDVSIPRQIPEVRAGGVYELDLLYQATLAGPMSDTLSIESNDPDQPAITVPLSGSGQPTGNDVVALELRFDNDSDTFLDADLRDVDLLLESPDGRICGKRDPAPSWGAFGSPRWSAQGTKENPERIVLPDAMQDGRYLVTLSYQEDCSTLPTALVAQLLGIGADELIDYLSDGGIGVDPDMLADAVAQTCLNRSRPNATVVVSINGAVARELPVELRMKGDLVEALRLVRNNGNFAVE